MYINIYTHTYELPTAKFRMWPGTVDCVRGGSPRCSASLLRLRVPKERMCMPKKSKMEPTKNTNKIGWRHEPRNFPKQPVRNRIE